jgi:uncharacterized small protein (DUF1192 family)
MVLVRLRFAAATLARPSEARKEMVSDPDDLPKKTKTEIVLGQDLSAMSEFELTARIAALESEIARAREAIKARQATKSAADAFFKKS